MKNQIDIEIFKDFKIEKKKIDHLYDFSDRYLPEDTGTVTRWYSSFEQFLENMVYGVHVIRWNWLKDLNILYIYQANNQFNNIYRCAIEEVYPSDEPMIREFLEKEWNKLKEDWKGIS